MTNEEFFNQVLPSMNQEEQNKVMEFLAGKAELDSAITALEDPLAQIQVLFDKAGSFLATYDKGNKKMLAYAVEGYFATDVFIANGNMWDVSARSFVAVFGDDNQEAKDDKFYFSHTTMDEFIELFPQQCDEFKSFIASL